MKSRVWRWPKQTQPLNGSLSWSFIFFLCSLAFSPPLIAAPTPIPSESLKEATSQALDRIEAYKTANATTVTHLPCRQEGNTRELMAQSLAKVGEKDYFNRKNCGDKFNKLHVLKEIVSSWDEGLDSDENDHAYIVGLIWGAFERNVVQPENAILICDPKGQLASFAVVQFINNSIEIEYLVTSPQNKVKGAGKAAVKEIVKKLLSSERTSIELTTIGGAAGFYQHLKFRKKKGLQFSLDREAAKKTFPEFEALELHESSPSH